MHSQREEGEIVIPAMAFKQALDGVAKRLGDQIPGKGKSTYTKHTLLAASSLRGGRRIARSCFKKGLPRHHYLPPNFRRRAGGSGKRSRSHLSPMAQMGREGAVRRHGLTR